MIFSDTGIPLLRLGPTRLLVAIRIVFKPIIVMDSAVDSILVSILVNYYCCSDLLNLLAGPRNASSLRCRRTAGSKHGQPKENSETAIA